MKILIATDGSEYSRQAIEECCRFFGGNKTPEIKIVTVYETVYPMMGEPFALSGDYYRQFEEESKTQAEKFAADGAEIVRQKIADADISTEVLHGIPEREIIETAKNFHADLIIVGSHGRGFWGRLTLGSVSDAIIHHAPCSVFVSRTSGDK